MKKVFTSLPFKLLVGVVLGIIAGQLAGMESMKAAGDALMNVVVTVRFILSELINFCVPLIVIGFIAPSITRLGKSASQMLGVALFCAYMSSILAALLSMAAGYGIIPHLSIVSEVEGLKELPEVVFQLEIPQIMSVMSALVLSVLLGLACTWTNAVTMTNLLEEFQKIVLEVVTRVVIPVLPVFIGFTFCGLSYEGTITKQLPVFIQVVLIVMAGHFIWMAVLYIAAGIYSGSNPLKVIRNYGPAYITAVGTMSSAATLAVALRCAKKSEPVLRADMVDFGIPLFANIHLCSDRSDGAGRHACDDTGTDGKSGRRNSGRDRRADRRGDSGGICDAGSERGTDGRAQYDSDGDTCSHTGSTGSHRAGLAGDRTGNPLF